jgi:hypothetical protein
MQIRFETVRQLTPEARPGGEKDVMVQKCAVKLVMETRQLVSLLTLKLECGEQVNPEKESCILLTLNCDLIASEETRR